MSFISQRIYGMITVYRFLKYVANKKGSDQKFLEYIKKNLFKIVRFGVSLKFNVIKLYWYSMDLLFSSQTGRLISLQMNGTVMEMKVFFVFLSYNIIINMNITFSLYSKKPLRINVPRFHKYRSMGKGVLQAQDMQ